MNKTPKRTAFWLTPVARRGLRHRPHYALHYVFNRAVSQDPACEAQWAATPFLPADECHLIEQLGYSEPISEHSAAAIDESSAPVFKLSWKHELIAGANASTIGYVLPPRQEARDV